MRTSTAILSHGAVGLAQAGALASPNIPWWGQLLIQVGLLVGQGVLASINSNSDPNGNSLK